MVDQEVADILEEIRSRVRTRTNLPTVPAPTNSNGADVETVSEPDLPEPPPVTNNYSSLIVLARAWDRLPPLVSNRSGLSARLELWIKSKLKNALRWLTWEQINFNAATHRTFLELIESLTAYEQELHRAHHQLKKQSNELKKQLNEQWSAESDLRKEQFDQQQLEIDSQRAVIKTQHGELLKEIQNRRGQLAQQQSVLDLLQTELNQQRALLLAQQSDLKARLTEVSEQQAFLVTQQALQATTQQALLATQIDELRALHSKDLDDIRALFAKTLDAQQSTLQAQLESLVQEFRGRDERLLDEQRVCVKQLSLELRESQVLQDRARREVELRIAKLEERENG